MRLSTSVLALSVSTLAIVLAGGCDSNKHHDSMVPVSDMHTMPKMATSAIAVLYPTAGNNVAGIVHFTQGNDAVRVLADIQGLPPNTTHGFHIHEFGDSSAPDAASAGGHFNPEHHPHAGPMNAMHHAGDLGNIVADANGAAHLDLSIQGLTLNGAKDAIVGRSVVLHAKPDDLKTQPTGDSGPRIACGVIGIAKEP